MSSLLSEDTQLLDQDDEIDSRIPASLSVDDVWEESGEYVDSDDDRTSGISRVVLPSPRPLTVDVLKEVQQELGLINLCWPTVEIKDDLYFRTVTSSYSTVNGKERVLAWYAENFRRQFRFNYPDRKPLLLVCENECGVQKFVSTTIRRSTLPYPELYTWQGCGKFVSDYIEYEPLEKPLSMPKQLRSPTWLLYSQKGNSFEIATFLTSLLLGQGYNAFVISGYASREQTLCDMTKTPCPYLPKSEEPEAEIKSPSISRYEFKFPSEIRSQLELQLEAEKEEALELEKQGEEAARLKLIEELECLPPDKYKGHRVHAWVLVLPKFGGPSHDEIQEPFFIEPASGVRYELHDPQTNELYFQIESIWNDENYWVNMQPCSNDWTKMNWNLSKPEYWEHLLPGESGIFDQTDEVDEETLLLQEKHLDMPASYVQNIEISDENFEKRYPNGKKILFYKKTKVELFAPYYRLDGSIQRVTTYEDYNYSSREEVFKKYSNRADNLIESRRKFADDSNIDYYKRGRPDKCKEHRYFLSNSETPNAERVIDYYDQPRLDGLSRIEMHPTHLTQHFVERDDRLYYQHAEFSPENEDNMQDDNNSRCILGIIQKYHRNESIPASKDIAIREFSMTDNEIRVMYHYGENQLSRTTRNYIKPPLADRGDRLTLNPAMTGGYNPNPNAESEKLLDLFYDLRKHLTDEDKSVSQIRMAEVEVSSFLSTRRNEYFTPQLLISIFDRHRNMELLMDHLEVEEKVCSQNNIEEIDYIKPLVARLGNPSEIDEEQAHLLRDECLNSFKQCTIRKANQILRTIEIHTQELRKLQTLLTQGEDLTEEEENQVMEETNKLNFKLHVLEVRLNRHRERTSKRYKSLVDYLQNNVYLSSLWK